MHADIQDTIVAIATPSGEGAIGIIRLSGEKAISIADECFYGKELSSAASHTIHFGTIRDGGELIDEVLLSVFRNPASYTGEDVVEVSCHGSLYILQRMVQLFVQKGARLAKAGEFTMRAFLHGKLDLSQAEAVADLIASETKGAHDLAIRQMRGGFSDEIKALRQQLLDFASLIELELDFSEEDVEFANRKDLSSLIDQLLRLIRALVSSFQLGNVIKRGVSTVIVGRPNAGKSTLLNTLLQEERAIVSDIPGTTRDTIEELLNIRGISFRLVDTAGLREATDKIESLGVQRTMDKIRDTAMLIYVFDAAQLRPDEVLGDLEQLGMKNIPVLIVANKCDLEGAAIQNQARWLQLINSYRTIRISALQHENINEVRDAIYHTAIQQQISDDRTIVSNVRHLEALSKAGESLQQVNEGLSSGISSDFIAMDIRQALHYLGEITGEVTTDEILGNIFSRFCIGK